LAPYSILDVEAGTGVQHPKALQPSSSAAATVAKNREAGYNSSLSQVAISYRPTMSNLVSPRRGDVAPSGRGDVELQSLRRLLRRWSYLKGCFCLLCRAKPWCQDAPAWHASLFRVTERHSRRDRRSIHARRSLAFRSFPEFEQYVTSIRATDCSSGLYLHLGHMESVTGVQCP